MAKLKDGFYKLTAEAIGNNSYMLLAGGGSKALSDFATASGVVTALGTNGNYVTWTKNGTANNLTVPYATNADKLDNIDSTGFFVTGRGAVDIPYIDLTTYTNDHADYKNYNSGTYSVGRSNYTDTYVIFRATGSTSAIELLANYLDTARLKLRKTIDSRRVSGPWRELAFTSDIPTKVSLLTNDSGYLTQHQSLSNYVTLNGTLTVTGLKTFSHNLLFSSIGGSSATDTSVTYPAESKYIGWSGATDWARIFFRITEYNEGHQVFKLGDDSDKYSTWIFEYPSRVAATISTTGINPGVTTDLTLGTKDLKWKNVYSTTFTGNLDGTAKALANYYSSRPNSIAPGVTGDGSMFHFLCTSAVTDSKTDPGDAHILHFNWDSTGGYDFQIAGLTNESTMKIRGMSLGTWQSWATVLSSANYTSYVNTTNFPGLNSVGDITGVTAGAGLGGGGTSGSVTLTNAGVRSATINGNYLRVNTNGTNADLTIPYATNATNAQYANLLKCIMLPSSTDNAGGTVWCKFARVTFNTSAWCLASGFLFFSGAENPDHRAILSYHFRSDSTATSPASCRLQWLVKSNDILQVIAVKVENNVYDLYVNNQSTYCSPLIYHMSDTYSRFILSAGNWSATKPTATYTSTDIGRVNYATSAGNTDKLDGYHAGLSNGSVAIYVPFPEWTTLKNEGYINSSYGTDGYGHPDDEFLQGICKWAIATYSNKGDITLIGRIAPNSSGTCILHLYSSSGKDSTTKLPKYCRGQYMTLNGNLYQFGTNNYVWSYELFAKTADITNHYWANVKISSSSSTTTTPTFKTATATTSIATPFLSSPGKLTLNATNTGVDLTFNNDDTKSVILNGTHFKPHDAANDKLYLGSSSARWSEVYSVKGNFTGDVTLLSSSGDSPKLYFVRGGAIGDSNALWDWRMYSSDGHFYLLSDLGAGTWSTLLFINTSNNVGIGTATPSYKLDVKGSIRANGNVLLEAANTISGGGIAFWNGSGYVNGTINGAILALNANGASGNVGIGTYNPSTKLHVLGSSKDFNIPVGLTENSATGDSWYAIHSFTNPEMSANEYAAILIGKKNNLKNIGHLSFFYAGDSSDNNRFALGFRDVLDLLVVKANGNVGIGTTSPAEKLHVNGLVNIEANSGILTIGCQNTLYTHYSTTGGTHWFNKAVEINGSLTPHANASFNLGSSSKRWSNIYGANGNFSTKLNIDSGSDAKIVLNNTDTETKYQYISFRQDGTEYGYLGTLGDNTLKWSGNTILHSGNSSVSKSGQTLTVKINGVEQSLTNTTYSSLKNPNAIKFKNTSGTTITYDGSSAADLTAGVNYATSAGTATTISGFTKRATANCTWGTLTASNEYTPVYWGDTASSGGFGFSDKGGKTYMQIDGDYYAQEGTKLVLHTGNSSVSGGGSSGGSSITVNIGGTSKTLTIPTSLPANGGNADTVDGQHFNWNNNKNDHTYLWAASSNGQAYLVHRASMSVNYANSAGTAGNSDLLDGYDSSRFLRAKDWITRPGLDADTLELNMMCFTYSNNAPHTGTIIYFSGATGGTYGLLLNASYSSSGYLSFRSRNGDSGTWKDWSTILTQHNYTGYINTTNFPGLNKVGTVTQVIAGTGISVSATTANQSTYTVTNAGVRSTTINGNYLRVNTNGTNADLTIPYATTASLLNNTSVSDPSTAASGQNVKWYSQINNSYGYAGTNYGFPVSNNANGILWLGTHSGPFGWLMGFSSNGHIYARYISNNSFSTTANGGSWNKIVWAYEAFPINAYNCTSGCLVKLNISSNSNSMISVHITGNAYRTSAASKVINSIVEFYNYQDGNDILNYNATHFGYNFGDINIFNYDNKVCLWFKQKYNYMSFSVFANYTNSGSANNKVLSISNSAMPTSGVTRSKTITPNTIAYSSDLTWSSISSKPSFATVATSGSYNDLSNKPTSLPANGGNADTVDNLHASAFAKIGTYNNLTHTGNEFTFASSAFSGPIWFNYRTASGSTDGNITRYYFGNGKGEDLAYISNSYFSGTAAAANSVAWSNVTGKPTIPTVTNYYWANVKISSSSNEATTPTFNTIATTGVSYVATLRPSTTNKHYLGSADNRWNGVFSKAGNFSGLITLSVATGTSPFKITSTTVNTNLNADMVDGKHASDFAEASHSHSYLPLAGGTMTGNIVAHVGDTQRGIKFGSGYLNSLSNQLLWQSDEAIRFGSATWDWNAWAGLKYKHSSKIIYLGLADGTVFKANSALSGGKLYLPGISDAYTGNGTYKILHAGNSSVSGGGSTWGSSITVKINGTTKTLTIPSNPNTWRGITDSYSGTDSTISLSQKGGNALYNALVNGYAASAGNAETVDNYHIWVGTSSLLPSTKVNNTIYIII